MKRGEKQLRRELHPNSLDAAHLSGQEDHDTFGDFLPDCARQRCRIGILLVENVPGSAPPAHEAEPGKHPAADDAQPDPDQSGQDPNAAESKEKPDDLAADRDRRDIAVADRRHCDQRVPDRVPDAAETGISGFLLPNKQKRDQKQI